MSNIFFIISFLFFVGYFLDSEILLPICGIGFIICLIYYIRELKGISPIYHNWLCPSYIVLLGLIIVCFQTLLNIYLNLGTFETYLPLKYGQHLTKCTYIGMISVIGYMIGCGLIKNKLKIPESDIKSYVLWPWLIVLSIIFYLFIINIDLASFITGANYQGSGAYDRTIDKSSYYEQLLNVILIIVTAIITQRLCNTDTKITIKFFFNSFPIIYWGVFFGYIFLRCLSGDRGPVLYTLSLVFYSYLMSTKKIFKSITVIGLIFLAALSTTILGFARTGDLNESFTQRIENAITTDEERRPSIIPATQELANSINTEFIAVDAMNIRRDDFCYGKYTFFALISSIPGSSSLLSNVFDLDIRKTLSSEYITIYEKGNTYSFGLGTSPMAEFYLEFGVFGCFFGLMFLGWIFSFIDEAMLGSSKNVSVILIIFLLKMSSIAIYIARSSVATSIAKALYIIIIFWILNKIFNLFKQKKYA